MIIQGFSGWIFHLESRRHRLRRGQGNGGTCGHADSLGSIASQNGGRNPDTPRRNTRSTSGSRYAGDPHCVAACLTDAIPSNPEDAPSGWANQREDEDGSDESELRILKSY